MKITRYILLITLFAVAACGGPKLTISKKTTAEQAFAIGNYTDALASWKAFISESELEALNGEDFVLAAITAYKAGDIDQAIKWFDQARYKNYSSIPMYTSLASIYKEKDNLSKELSALETLVNELNDPSMEVKARLFDIYVEIKEVDKALATWQNMDDTVKGEISRLESYFGIQKDKENKAACDALANLLLEKDPDNYPGMDWLAKKYYWLGENRYQAELAEYEANKTSKQYKILLKELDIATADLKKALTFLDKLWEQHKTKEYASYLASIYGRFGDKEKVAYYKGFMD